LHENYIDDTSDADKSDFLKEIRLMKKVSTGNNPHVINMVGCCTTQEPLALILDFAPNGDLLTILRMHKKEVYNVNMYNFIILISLCTKIYHLWNLEVAIFLAI